MQFASSSGNIEDTALPEYSKSQWVSSQKQNIYIHNQGEGHGQLAGVNQFAVQLVTSYSNITKEYLLNQCIIQRFVCLHLAERLILYSE